MSRQSNNKIIFGSAAGLFAVVALVWFFTRSGSAVEPSRSTPQPTVTMTEDEPAEPVARSEPRGSTGGARLGGAAAVEDKDDEGVTQKSKSKRSKKRQRRKQERDEEEEKETAAKKGKKQKYFGK